MSLNYIALDLVNFRNLVVVLLTPDLAMHSKTINEFHPRGDGLIELKDARDFEIALSRGLH